MTSASANTLWARSFTDELARAGVREVVLAPGSRSTPLVLAFSRDERFRVRVQLDERSAAFFALGVGKAARCPAVMVTTSGTAAANVLPAVVEAHESETPLLVLTADRPLHLRVADANQTIDQVRLYGEFVRDSFEVAEPTLKGPSLEHLRALANRAVNAASGPPSGPVHMNFPFDKPLEPEDPPEAFMSQNRLAAHGRPDQVPLVSISPARRSASNAQLAELVESLEPSRGVIIAGPHSEADRVGPAVWEFAAATNFPVLADALSGARFGAPDQVHVVGAYDFILRPKETIEFLKPSVILRVGSSPTSSALLNWMSAHNGVPHLVVDAGGRWKDHGVTATTYVQADPADTLTRLAKQIKMSASLEWVASWRAVGMAAREALEAEVGIPHEGEILSIVSSAVIPQGSLFVSSSMPVRDLDVFGCPHSEKIHVYGNRGASGIDGIISTAFGVASQCDGPVVCVLGDLAFFHDQNGLLWQREDDTAVVFVLIDNDGGGIFHMLPVAEHEPDFTRLIATPHGLDLSHAAALHGIVLRDVTIPELTKELGRALVDGITTVLRVQTDRTESHQRRVELAEAVGQSVREALR
ncbi:MAG: 2-succinyl-5-enolpyruvyl-6-hydroxy-3-cyclohexene-1-carboxylic-acid synthase [Gemmatimonadota bacterium]|nr:2-succinyl-5-enolpyruvyl-6-hydroxy-3-cyclohexene-1-carboxylic-acid synthase [Gemmatimonadota bacterium]